MRLKGLANASDEYFMVMVNDRVYYDQVVKLLDREADYHDMMRHMKSITASVRAERKVNTIGRPNRISVYLHMAASMDRIQDLHPTISHYATSNKYLVYGREALIGQKVKVPKRQEKAMKFKIYNISYIDGNDVEKMSKDDLFGCVNTANERKEALLKMQITSKAVDKELNELDAFIVDVVAIIDRRFG